MGTVTVRAQVVVAAQKLGVFADQQGQEVVAALPNQVVAVIANKEPGAGVNQTAIRTQKSLVVWTGDGCTAG